MEEKKKEQQDLPYTGEHTHAAQQNKHTIARFILLRVISYND